nr:hypothetical protein [Tanacetum cinerariifolium]
MGSTIKEDKEKMMDDLMQGRVCETKHATTHIHENKGCLAGNISTIDVIMNDTNIYKPIVDADVDECEAKDLLHVEVQDVTAHSIRVNTIVEDYQVDESEVDDVAVSEPQVDEANVDDT